MWDEISLAKITRKPRFYNAKWKSYHGPIPKAINWKEYPRENNTRTTKV